MNKLKYLLTDETATIDMGKQIARVVQQLSTSLVVYLHGDLGAGKTTLTRGFVQGMGHQGKVKSPTYTLVEPYELPPWQVYHFDLYRLADPEELEYMGIREYFSQQSCCFVEWPEKGQDMIPSADIELWLHYVNEQREITLQANNSTGNSILQQLINSELSIS